jgi:hypothetical protein
VLLVCSGQYLSEVVQGGNSGELAKGQRITGGKGSPVHVRSNGWPMWSNPTDKLLLLKLLKKLMQSSKFKFISKALNKTTLTIVLYSSKHNK